MKSEIKLKLYNKKEKKIVLQDIGINAGLDLHQIELLM
jgi:hypothetical protein